MSASRTAPQPPPPPKASPPRNRPQFSMRAMLIAVTVFAIVVALSQLVDDDIFAILMMIVLLCAIPVCLATLSFYCRGDRQTFFLGGLAGAGLMFVIGCTLVYNVDWRELLWFALFEAVTIVTCAMVALHTRRFVERRGWHLPAENDDHRPPR